MAYQYKLTRRVEFSDTDMAGIVHFSRFFIFMEAVEHAFYRSLGFSVYESVEGAIVCLPRLEVSCSYTKPLLFEDEVEAQLLIRAISQKTIRYEVIFRRINGFEPEEVARGAMIVVCVQKEGDTMKSIPIPDRIRSHLEVAPEGAFVS